MAAAAPCPSALAAKNPGATSVTVTDAVNTKPFAPVKLSEHWPGWKNAGRWKLICPGETKKRGTGKSLSASSRNRTLVPARVVGSGSVVAACVVFDKFTPKAATMESRAIAPGKKLAAETLVGAAGKFELFGVSA